MVSYDCEGFFAGCVFIAPPREKGLTTASLWKPPLHMVVA